MSLIELPDFLTVEEAAEVLRLGRSQAYELTRIYRVTGGSRGLPVVGVRTAAAGAQDRDSALRGRPAARDAASRRPCLRVGPFSG
jgi:hypothetical protein